MRPHLSLLILFLACTIAGCASGIDALSNEDDVPELAALKQKTARYENHTAMVPTTRASESRVVRIAIHRIDRPDAGRVFVLMHGVMADHNAYRFMVGDLIESGSVWLIDLPGCGDSDKPDPAALAPDGYSPAAMGDRVLDALDQELRSLPGPAPRVTLVGHSLSGAITIRMLADPELAARHETTLSRVDGAVLFSPLDVAVNRPDPLFREIATMGPTKVNAASALGVLEDRIVAATKASVCDPTHALREECDARIRYLTNPVRRRALQAMLRQAVPWEPGYTPDWDAMEAVVSLYANVSKPCLIVWGERDEILPCSMGYKLAAQIPGAKLICLPRVKHSPEIECPGTSTRLIRDFASGSLAPAVAHEAH